MVTATEVEGCAPAADWSRWIRDGRAAPSDGLTFAESWREDLEQLAGLGVDAVVLTLEWARLVPRPGEIATVEVEHRRELLAAARAAGLTVWACLVDGTLPGWFADDEGGFADDRARQLVWPRHIDWVGERFGDLVDGWIPQREPLLWAARRFATGEAPPGRRDARLAAAAVRAAMEADGEAWRLLQGTAPVATYQTARAIRAARAPSGEEDVRAVEAARFVERLLWHPWVSALGEGVIVAGDLPHRSADHLRGAFDRVVVELRPAVEVDAAGRWRVDRPDPVRLGESLHRAIDELDGYEIVAAGNLAGVADDGRARPDHVQAMIELTAEAASSSGVAGWWQSSPIDGYRWGRPGRIPAGLITAERVETAAATRFRALASSSA